MSTKPELEETVAKQAAAIEDLQGRLRNALSGIQQLTSERDFYRLETDKAQSARDHYRDSLMDNVARDLRGIHEALIVKEA